MITHCYKQYRLILHDPMVKCMASKFERFSNYNDARSWAIGYAHDMRASAVEVAVKCANRFNHYYTIEVIDL